MKPLRLIPGLLAVVLLATCSRSPDLSGTWKNEDGHILTIGPDTLVLLGQEGIPGGDSGSYSYRDMEVRIVTKMQSDRLGSYRNEYFLLHRNDSLLLQRVTLIRGRDFHEITIDSLARRLGKPIRQFAFTRRAKP